jgi:hypothetical protein
MNINKRLPRLSRNVALVTVAVFAVLFLGVRPTLAQFNSTIFGPNVYVIPATASPATVTSVLNTVNNEAQFSTNRWAVLFMPGSYGTTSNSVYADIGYYESVAGLGQTPGQVTITGGLVADQLISGNLTQNFWRSQENLSQIPVGGQTSGVLDWGVSQGASLRRENIQGGLRYANVNCNESSGGFTADIAISGLTNACSQQQWYTRNSALPVNGWNSFVWNFVFSGVTNAPAQNYPGSSPTNAVTNIPTTPVSREKPFLYVDGSGNYNVFVPTLKTNSAGTSWASGGLGTGYSMPISDFFIATPSSTLAQINAALASGQSLILTPGIYQYTGAINVTNANTIVLGMGYATLVPQSGTSALTVADVDGVQVAGLIIDAGPVNSAVLLEVGNPNGPNNSHATNPTSLNDVFFRVGGAAAGTATTSLQVDSGNVILDNIWAWRADHGNGVGWTVNVGEHGLVVNGNNVTALGLAVEHYEQAQVQWNGNGGETIFYQSELPYDPPSQSAWMDGAANGYPSYVVGPAVCSHTAYGLGIYSFFDLGVSIVDDNAMTVPNTAGVNVTDVGTVFLGGSGQISNVINGTGGLASGGNAGSLVPVKSYTGTGTCAVTAPAAPAGLAAVNEPPQGSNPNPSVRLTWNASTTPNVTYTIYRGTASATPISIQAGVTTTSFVDTTVVGSTSYTYYVVAVSGATPSSPSNQVTLTTGAAQVAPPTNLTGTASGTQVNLSWTASTTTGVTYAVERATGSGSATSIKTGLTSTTFADTTVVSGTTYTYYVVAVISSGASSSPSNSVSVTGGGTLPVADIVAINAGGIAVGNFAADEDFVGGGTYAPGLTVTIPTGLAGAAPEAVYQDARQGAFTYTIPGLTTGNTYTVVLHFAELYFSATGQRVFNVAINGTTVLPNFDIVAAAGGGLRAVVEKFPNITPNSSGQIVVSFTNGTHDQPMFNGLEIQGVATPPPTATLINAGGAATGSYAADEYFSGGGTYAPGTIVTVPANLANAAPAAVYEDARQGVFTYTINGLGAGTSHTVTLHFAELYFTTTGQRVFNVAINGTTVLPNFDIVAAAGGKPLTAVVEQFPNITANSSGQIVISFTNGTHDQPMFNGLVVQ